MLTAQINIIVAIFATGIGAVMAFILVKMFDRLRRKDAMSEAAAIIAKATQDADNRRRESELQLKEMILKQQEESEKELRKIRGELHERERLLDKRQDALEEQAEQVRKQEKMVEATQRKLTEKIQDTNRRKEELAKLLDLQRQTLHELSGLNQDEATRRLLEMLEQPAPAGDRRRDPRATSASWPKSASRRPARSCITALQRYAAAAHRRDHHQHRRHSQRRNEGPHHRPRGPQHPRLREGHRRRRDHRRHAGRGHRQRLRHGPPRGRPHWR